MIFHSTYDITMRSIAYAMDLRGYSDVNLRRKYLEKTLKVKFPHIGRYSLNAKSASARNCENMIGVIQIPLGVAGPLKIKSALQNKEVFVPLATTEGALVASVSRGAKAITLSGGTNVSSERVGITRAPVFAVENIEEGEKITKWIENNFIVIKSIVEKTSSHLKLLGIDPWIVGRNLFLRFKFDSQDAMGMNMATIACTIAADYIEKKTRAKLVSISGNICVDKKPNMLNFIEGRGIKVWADCILPLDIVKRVLKTTPEKFVNVVTRKVYLGSIISGSIGANSHAANVLAAVFAATGQDLAHIAEVSSVVTTAEIIRKDLYVSVNLSDLVVGTVGGGTGLETQKEALDILGIFGGNKGKNAQKFSEIVAATVLAGEISLLSSLEQQTLAQSHQKLARGGK